MYQYDLHCHTKESSPCGNVRAAVMIKEYQQAGYNGLVVTDHAYPGCQKKHFFNRKRDFVDYFLQGYHALLQAAGEDFTILLGMEIRFEENRNDYLVYGVTEEFLRRHGGLALCKLGVEKFSALAKEEGLLLVQAHPFRTGLVRADARFLDGVEVNNGNQRHNSRNSDALAWAEQHHLMQTSGSDYHELEDLAQGGICTAQKITTSDDLIRILRSGDYTVIRAKKEKK